MGITQYHSLSDGHPADGSMIEQLDKTYPGCVEVKTTMQSYLTMGTYCI